MTAQEIKEIIDVAITPETLVTQSQQLRIFDIFDFIKLVIPSREDILKPIIKTQSLIMIFAQRGIGKTFIALAIAYAIASGGKFLKWQAPKARRVIYIDGEMPATVMQSRLAQIVNNADAKAEPGYFTIITPDMQPGGMPDISTQAGQEAIEPYIRDADVVIIDNISTLARTGKENEAEGWLPVQEWALQLRSRGQSVIFIHHAGKGGQQRGTSRREDVLDIVIELKRPENYKTSQGACFQVHFTKCRHLVGNDTEPFEASLTESGWIFKSIEQVAIDGDKDVAKVLELKDKGLAIRKIADELQISKSTVQRIIQRYASQRPVP